MQSDAEKYFISSLANFALSSALSHCVRGELGGGEDGGRKRADGRCGQHGVVLLLIKNFGEGCASIARATRLRGGVACRRRRARGGRGERSIEFGHFGVLLLELDLMRKDVAEAGLEVRQPGGDFGHRTALLGKLHL